jgi:hypothetical protein
MAYSFLSTCLPIVFFYQNHATLRLVILSLGCSTQRIVPVPFVLRIVLQSLSYSFLTKSCRAPVCPLFFYQNHATLHFDSLSLCCTSPGIMPRSCLSIVLLPKPYHITFCQPVSHATLHFVSLSLTPHCILSACLPAAPLPESCHAPSCLPV